MVLQLQLLYYCLQKKNFPDFADSKFNSKLKDSLHAGFSFGVGRAFYKSCKTPVTIAIGAVVGTTLFLSINQLRNAFFNYNTHEAPTSISDLMNHIETVVVYSGSALVAGTVLKTGLSFIR